MIDLPITRVSFNLSTQLSLDRLEQLTTALSNHSQQLTTDVTSIIASDYVYRIFNESVLIITMAVFAYIGFVILINIVNVTLTNFQKRKSEIATFRLIGMERKQLQRMFLWETLSTGFVPWLIGVIVGNILSYFIYRLTVQITEMNFLQFSINVESILFSLVLALLIVVIQMVALRLENRKLNIIEDFRRY